MGRQKRGVMLWSQTQIDESKRIDLAIAIELLIGLKPPQGIDGIIIPLTVHFTFEVAPIGQGFLDFCITVRVGVQLIRGCGWTCVMAAMRCFRRFAGGGWFPGSGLLARTAGGFILRQLLCCGGFGRKICRGSYKQQRGDDPFHAQNKRLSLRWVVVHLVLYL